MSATSAIDHAVHTAYSDPGRHRRLVGALPTDPAGLSAVARNVIVHYRASGQELPAATRDDINSRWLAAILDADQARHGHPFAAPREVTARVQGCCRDHTLFCVGALRTRGIPARSRVGFAGYFVDGWHHDHVVVEARLDERWRRFDAEVDAPRAGLASPMDFGTFPVDSHGFVTAAQVWLAHRAGEVDASTYGVDPEVPGFRGERFVFDEVIHEVAHRFGDELLLWDGWGRIGEPDEPVTAADAHWIDEVARLLVAADDGDLDAEHRLLARYRADPGLHPGDSVLQASPYGDPPVEVALTR
jgi:hypothetical protein